MLRIETPRCWDRLLGWARSSPAREVCGLLLGDDPDPGGGVRVERRVRRAVLARNVAQRPETRYEIDPCALFDAHRAARSGADPVIGVFHSHPRGPTRPSERDLAEAWTGLAYLILDAAGGSRCWRLAGDRFEEERLARPPASAPTGRDPEVRRCAG